MECFINGLPNWLTAVIYIVMSNFFIFLKIGFRYVSSSLLKLETIFRWQVTFSWTGYQHNCKTVVLFFCGKGEIEFLNTNVIQTSLETAVSKSVSQITSDHIHCPMKRSNKIRLLFVHRTRFKSGFRVSWLLNPSEVDRWSRPLDPYYPMASSVGKVDEA